jgi:hypothetical protein
LTVFCAVFGAAVLLDVVAFVVPALLLPLDFVLLCSTLDDELLPLALGPLVVEALSAFLAGVAGPLLLPLSALFTVCVSALACFPLGKPT